MTRSFPRKYLAAPAAALGAAALAFTVLAQPAPASSHQISNGHWDLAAEVDCSGATGSITLVAENHDDGTVKQLSNVEFKVDNTNDVAVTSKDSGRFSSGPARVLTHDEAELDNDPNLLLLGFDVEYAANCGSNTPDVEFRVVSGSTVPTGSRAAAYKNTTGTCTDLDTKTGTCLNQGVVTDTHEDRRWGFQLTGDGHDLRVRARGNPTGNGNVSDTETVSFNVS